MSNEKLDELESERRGVTSESVESEDGATSQPATRPAKKTRKRRQPKPPPPTPDEILPVESFKEVSDFLLDGVCRLAGVEKRRDDEKQAVSAVSRNLLIKYAPVMEHSEEVLFFLVCAPIGLAIYFESVDNRRKRAGKTHGVDRSDRNREDASGEETSS